MKWILGLLVILLTAYILVSLCFLSVLAIPDSQTGKSILPLPIWTTAPPTPTPRGWFAPEGE